MINKKRRKIRLSLFFVILLLVVTITIGYTMYSLPVSGVSDYILQNTKCKLLLSEHTKNSIYCFISNDDKSKTGIITFDKKPFNRCVRRTLCFVNDNEEYTYDFFQTGNNDGQSVSFVCGGLNPQKFSKCNVIINQKRYTKNMDKKSFLFVIELNTPSDKVNTMPMVEFEN